MNIKMIPKNTELFTYEKLNQKAKMIARCEIISMEINYLTKRIYNFRNKIKTDIHYCVNNSNEYKSFVRTKSHINKIMNIKLLEDYIIANLCEFTQNGIYVTYYI